jgi:hypothetical protein
MPAGEMKKPECPLIWATIAWTPNSDKIVVKFSRLDDWSLLRTYEKIGGNTGLAWRQMHVRPRKALFRELVEKITEIDKVDPAAIDDALSVIPEYRQQVALMDKDAYRANRKPDPEAELEIYRMLRAQAGDGEPVTRASIQELAMGPRGKRGRANLARVIGRVRAAA